MDFDVLKKELAEHKVYTAWQFIENTNANMILNSTGRVKWRKRHFFGFGCRKLAVFSNSRSRLLQLRIEQHGF